MQANLRLAARSSVTVVTENLLSGLGNTLKWIELITLFGTLLGEILALTCRADVIADSVIKVFGVKHLLLAIVLSVFLVGIPVFVAVA